MTLYPREILHQKPHTATMLINSNHNSPCSQFIPLKTKKNVKKSIYKTKFKDKRSNDWRPIFSFRPWACKGVERSRGFHKNRGASIEISHAGALKNLFSSKPKKSLLPESPLSPCPVSPRKLALQILPPKKNYLLLFPPASYQLLYCSSLSSLRISNHHHGDGPFYSHASPAAPPRRRPLPLHRNEVVWLLPAVFQRWRERFNINTYIYIYMGSTVR